jgi:O-antigen ligase
VIFALTALALIYVCVSSWQKRQAMVATISGALAAVFIAHVLIVAPSRTAIAILIVLLPVVLFQLLAWRMVIALSLAALLVCVAAAAFSPALRLRVNETFSGIATPISAAETSENLRLAYWKRAAVLMREAPISGHGTGGTRRAFAEIDGYDLKQGVPNNPHNQTLAIGTQLGVIGVFLLWGMWLAHLLSSRGQRWEAKLCALIVLQNIIASMFNSHLFDFTAGWIYVLGVGILGGAAWGAHTAAPRLSNPVR